mmetsp:Transcript_10036/g.18253  ORF Transcript_10036/g.18253 Transcript_10036/m.18253 type:complete len:250 (+) Transcript_10036:76-825(+)
MGPKKDSRSKPLFSKAKMKAIMQIDEEVGRMNAVVPILMSKAVEIFGLNLVKEACRTAQQRNHTTLQPPHIKQCVMEKKEFDFLKRIVKDLPDISSIKESKSSSSQHTTNNKRKRPNPNPSSAKASKKPSTTSKPKPNPNPTSVTNFNKPDPNPSPYIAEPQSRPEQQPTVKLESKSEQPKMESKPEPKAEQQPKFEIASGQAASTSLSTGTDFLAELNADIGAVASNEQLFASAVGGDGEEDDEDFDA